MSERPCCCCGGGPASDPWAKLAAKPLRMVLLGGPGVGKGTQAEILKAKLGLTHLSTGDIFRAIAKGAEKLTPAMEQALAAMKSGALVPDATVIELVGERVAKLNLAGGVLFDGFPRTVAQAESLDKMLAGLGSKLDVVVSYDLPNATLIQRLSGRRTCTKCGASFHVANRPPKVEGVCNNCGTALIQRPDDQPDAIAVRLETYEKSTKPLIDFYRASGRLVVVPADGSPADVSEAGAKLLVEFACR
jgi:adenylate kinase